MSNVVKYKVLFLINGIVRELSFTTHKEAFAHCDAINTTEIKAVYKILDSKTIGLVNYFCSDYDLQEMQRLTAYTFKVI